MDLGVLEKQLKEGEVVGLLAGVVSHVTPQGYRHDVYPQNFGKNRKESLYIQRLIRFNKAYLQQHDNQQKIITLAVQEGNKTKDVDYFSGPTAW